MKFTLSWLQKYLKTKKSLNDICEKLTMLGIEVSDIIDNQNFLKQFKIAEVIYIQNHPNADKLKICKVNDGKNNLSIICGAPNVKKGMKVVLAPVGTKMLEEDFIIQKSKIRGVESEGMLCSEKEIGFGINSDGIIQLEEKAKVGNLLSTLFPSEKIIDVEVTPNRSDCLGVYGIARDLAAGSEANFIEKKISNIKGNFKSKINIKIKKEAKPVCPVFYGRYIRNIKNCESPDWLKKQLQAVGLKPISALVDITNYLTIDYNRPLHVFDADKIDGDLKIFLAKGGENLKALDEQNYKLSKEMIVIKDNKNLLSIAGVIGGVTSMCDLNTKNVFLESALFDPISVAKTGRLLNIETEARYRFERGVDPQSVSIGMDEATKLIMELCGGDASEIIYDGKIPLNKKQIIFDINKIESFIGIKISEKIVQNILNNLGFKVAKNGAKYKLSIPTWRHDIENEADIMEEIIRIHGYDKIPSRSIYINNVKKIDNRCQIRELNIKRSLAQRGLTETVTWSFMSNKNSQIFGMNNILEIQNPISNDLDVMRQSIIPNLLDAVRNNIANGEEKVCLFELGPVFDVKYKDEQQIFLSGIRCGNSKKHWLEKERTYDVFDVKSDLEAVLRCCKLPPKSYVVNNGSLNYFHPGKSGSINFPTKSNAGFFGEIHPDIIKKFQINFPIYAFELNLNALPHEFKESKKIFNTKNFQKVERDFAFIIDKKIESKIIIDLVNKVQNELINEINIFDLYEGEEIPEGKKSIAISIVLQPKEKTLKDSEIESICKNIISNVVENTDAVLREK
jgi:phenylalanyl-tRNA synthetase beta chain